MGVVPPKVTATLPQPSGAPTRPRGNDRGTGPLRTPNQRARTSVNTSAIMAREPGRGQGIAKKRRTYADHTPDDDIDPDAPPRRPVIPPAFNDGRVTFPKPHTDAWFALAHPPPLKGARRAPEPPPGYRYRMDGVLVPLIDPRLSVEGREGQAVFLEILEYTGSQRAAMDAIGVCSARTVERVLEKDQDFFDAYQAAINRHRDAIYMAAYERSVHGVLRPVVGGKFKDEIVTYERHYSDGLTALLLKRHFQEFRDADKGAQTNVNVQTNVVLPAEVGRKIRGMSREQRDAMRLLLPVKAQQQAEAAVQVADDEDATSTREPT